MELKFVYAYDQYSIPIDSTASLALQRTIYDYDQGFSQRIPDYWRLDLRVAITFRPRKNDEIFHYLGIELLNIANTKNVAGYYFDRMTQDIQTRYQLPIYLELLYRARF